MMGVNPDNERIKRRYFRYLREAEGRAEKTLDHASRAIADFERFSDWKPFRKFNAELAMAYRRNLLAGKGKRSAQLSSRATVNTKLVQVQKFFRWLALQPGFKKSITLGDTEYFNLNGRDRRLALEAREKPTPTLEQVQNVIRAMPAGRIIERRDRAVMACILLTGVRVAALTSLKVKHVRRDQLGIDQDAREVRTKFSKSYPTFFFPVGDDIRRMFLDYVQELRNELGWGSDDPLFPANKQGVGSHRAFHTIGLQRRHWQTSDPVRVIFRRAYARVQFPYYSPHSLRRTLVQLGQRVCSTPEELKAWSQNLGHEEVLTSFTSYGRVPDYRQSEILRTCCSSNEVVPGKLEELLQAALAEARSNHGPFE